MDPQIILLLAAMCALLFQDYLKIRKEEKQKSDSDH